MNAARPAPKRRFGFSGRMAEASGKASNASPNWPAASAFRPGSIRALASLGCDCASTRAAGTTTSTPRASASRLRMLASGCKRSARETREFCGFPPVSKCDALSTPAIAGLLSRSLQTAVRLKPDTTSVHQRPCPATPRRRVRLKPDTTSVHQRPCLATPDVASGFSRTLRAYVGDRECYEGVVCPRPVGDDDELLAGGGAVCH